MERKTDLKTKANLGCGPLPLYEQDLSYMDGGIDEWLLIDKYIKGPGIVNWDMEELNEIPDNHLEKIYTSHALEHVSHKGVSTVIAHWFSKLREGGVLIINVPDLAWAAEQVLKYENYQVPQGMYTEWFGKYGLLSIFYGSHSQIGEVHFSGFTKRAMTELLEEAGFQNIEVEQMYDAHQMQVLIARGTK